MSNFVQFRKQAIQDNYQTQVQEHPVFIEKDFINIKIPDDRNLVIDREVREEDKINYPHEWQRYLNNSQVSVTGFPLEEWPQVTASQIAALKYGNVFTVEQVAALSDLGVQNFGMGALALREKAIKYLNSIAENKDKNELNARIEELEKKLREVLETKPAEPRTPRTKKTSVAEQNENALERISDLNAQIESVVEEAA
jgi:hypothetical protein